MKRLKPILILLLVVTCMSPAAAFADTVTLTLSHPAQGAPAGQTLDYVATVFAPNTNGATVFLNGDRFTLAAPFTLDDSPYFTNFPLSLDPGQSYTGVLFDVALPADALSGDYFGSFQITGGPTDSDTALLASADFSTTVTPEPSTLLLLGTGVVSAFGFARRRMAAQL